MHCWAFIFHTQFLFWNDVCQWKLKCHSDQSRYSHLVVKWIGNQVISHEVGIILLQEMTNQEEYRTFVCKKTLLNKSTTITYIERKNATTRRAIKEGKLVVERFYQAIWYIVHVHAGVLPQPETRKWGCKNLDLFRRTVLPIVRHQIHGL